MKLRTELGKESLPTTTAAKFGINNGFWEPYCGCRTTKGKVSARYGSQPVSIDHFLNEDSEHVAELSILYNRLRILKNGIPVDII